MVFYNFPLIPVNILGVVSLLNKSNCQKLHVFDTRLNPALTYKKCSVPQYQKQASNFFSFIKQHHIQTIFHFDLLVVSPLVLLTPL